MSKKDSPQRQLPTAPEGAPTFLTLDALNSHIVATLQCTWGFKTKREAADYGWRVGATRSVAAEGKQPKLKFSELCTVMETDPEWEGILEFDIRFNAIFLNKPVPGSTDPESGFPREMIGEDVLAARRWFGDAKDFDPKTNDCDGAMTTVARAKRHDRVREYLETLSWDGLPRLDGMLANCFGAVEDDEGYVRAIGSKWMISAVARALDWGCKVDAMLILEQEQGSGKTTGVAALAGPKPDFFEEGMDLRVDKDGLAAIRGPWICENGELQGLEKNGVEALKSFITRQTDTYRDPYMKRRAPHKRRCVFIGTTNNSQYLNDTTGGRRFWPVTVGLTDMSYIVQHRDQLWAEAVTRYRRGEKWYLEGDLIDVAKRQVENRTQHDELEALISRYLESRDERGYVRATVTVEEIASDVLKLEVGKWAIDKSAQTKIGYALRTLKWKKSQCWETKARFYTRPGVEVQGTRGDTNREGREGPREPPF